MTEIARIARLLKQTFEGKPYYGSSVLGALNGITAALAVKQPCPAAHSIWELVAHLTAELDYACTIVDRTAGSWVEGETTWPAKTDPSDAAWEAAIADMARANRRLVAMVSELDDAILSEPAPHVGISFYSMLHGTIQHNVYHAGQIALLKRQMTSDEPQS